MENNESYFKIAKRFWDCLDIRELWALRKSISLKALITMDDLQTRK